MKADEKKCPRCAEAIKKDALVCKHCGQEFSADQIAADKKAEAVKLRKGLLGCGGLVAFVLFLGAIGAGVDADEVPSANTASASSDSSPPKGEAAGVEARKGALAGVYRQMLAAAEPCDEAMKPLGQAASSEDRYRTYEAAKTGHERCRDAAMKIAELEAPSELDSESRRAVGAALTDCRSAYLFRQRGMEKAMEIADGESRPSTVSGMTEDLRLAQGGIIQCVAGFMQASEKAGLEIADLR